MPRSGRLRWQIVRRLVCRVRGHRLLRPFEVEMQGVHYVVKGCGRCGMNKVSQALQGNRAMRRRAARLARR